MKLIAAIGRNLELGKNDDLVWHIPADLKRFKSLTTGNTVIMGRRTWETLPKRPLPGRKNIVVTRNLDYEAPGAVVVSSLEEAPALAEGEGFIIGGASLYAQALPLCEELDLTEIDAADADADVYFPSLEGWERTEATPFEETPQGLRYRFTKWRRKG